jgi:RNA polymerase sigma-70 factor, ECF subfamily
MFNENKIPVTPPPVPFGPLPSFSAIYEKFRKPILSYVRQRIPGQDEEVAQEVTQEVFLKAFRFLPSYQPHFALSTWLWTIARNTVIDWTRSHHSRPLLDDRKYDPDAASDGPVAYEELPSTAPNAEVLMIQRADRRKLLLWMRALTRKQRKVIKLRIINQLSYSEIAKRLGMSLSSVKCLAHRAKLALLETRETMQAFI